MIVVDYYSIWFEIKKLNDQSSARVILIMKELFSTHGIPDIIVSDNGPQFSSDAFRLFATEYDFVHVTSSPKYPRANGEVERSVLMVKALLRKNEDPYQALLAYRSTPLQNGFSPSELLMGRRLRTKVPAAMPSVLKPNVQDTERQRVQLREDDYRSKQQIYMTNNTKPMRSLHSKQASKFGCATRTGKVRSLEPPNYRDPTW